MRLNVTDYAQHRRRKDLPGCSRKSVYEALNKGWIRKGRDGKIDVEAADAAWEAKSRPRADGQSAGSGDVEESDYGLHHARKEKALADKIEMEVRQRQGELVERAAVEAAWVTLGVLIRDRLGALPTRLASRCAVESDEHKVMLILRHEVESLLNELGDEAAGLDG